MGNWNITIQGVGQHYSGMDTDAEKMAERFAQEMRDAGHSVKSATVTYGGAEDVTPTGPTRKTIRLNGNTKEVTEKHLTHDVICAMAGHPGRMLSVTYSATGPNGESLGGIVSPGSSVPAYEGMHINAVDTSNA